MKTDEQPYRPLNMNRISPSTARSMLLSYYNKKKALKNGDYKRQCDITRYTREVERFEKQLSEFQEKAKYHYGKKILP